MPKCRKPSDCQPGARNSLQTQQTLENTEALTRLRCACKLLPVQASIVPVSLCSRAHKIHQASAHRAHLHTIFGRIVSHAHAAGKTHGKTNPSASPSAVQARALQAQKAPGTTSRIAAVFWLQQQSFGRGCCPLQAWWQGTPRGGPATFAATVLRHPARSGQSTCPRAALARHGGRMCIVSSSALGSWVSSACPGTGSLKWSLSLLPGLLPGAGGRSGRRRKRRGGGPPLLVLCLLPLVGVVARLCASIFLLLVASLSVFVMGVATALSLLVITHGNFKPDHLRGLVVAAAVEIVCRSMGSSVIAVASASSMSTYNEVEEAARKEYLPQGRHEKHK